MIHAVLCLLSPDLRLPAETAYFLEQGAARIGRSGEIRGWSDPSTRVLWGGQIKSTGELRVSLDLSEPAAGNTYVLSVKGPNGTQSRRSPDGVFPPVKIEKAGWHAFTLQASGKGPFGDIRALKLAGPATENAQFNLKERRNSASVHIGYPVPAGTQIEWMYNEVKAMAEPLYTFYEACGFSRGYFGMQINSPTERRVIFSVWDAGKEAVDRSKVGDENRVKLLRKGDGVEAGDFGNEGTGGHSHLVTPWRTGTVQRFLLHAVKDGDGTIYTGYYFQPERKDWMLIASFRAPKDPNLITRMYSFIENFGGENGHLKRSAEFGPVWIRTTDGQWSQCRTGRFTHDKTGGVDRFDYDFGVSGSRFLLQNGGFEGRSPKFGVEREAGPGKAPELDLDRISKL